MEWFRADGHLTNEALTALVRDGSLDELSRLEIAEHLSFCDACLQRYTDLLCGAELLEPERSCQKTLWARVRTRTLRLVTSRYATAAAAVALALTVLWSSQEITFSRPAAPQNLSAAAEHLHSWPDSLMACGRNIIHEGVTTHETDSWTFVFYLFLRSRVRPDAPGIYEAGYFPDHFDLRPSGSGHLSADRGFGGADRAAVAVLLL